jgi:hypothetical protein
MDLTSQSDIAARFVLGVHWIRYGNLSNLKSDLEKVRLQRAGMKEPCPNCKWIGFVFAALPFAWLAGLLALVIRARLFLGYWPRTSRPDPKSLEFELHHMSLWFGLFLLVLVFGGAVLFYAANIKRRPDLRPAVVFLSGLSIIVTLIFGSHFDFNWVAWLLD